MLIPFVLFGGEWSVVSNFSSGIYIKIFTSVVSVTEKIASVDPMSLYQVAFVSTC